MTTTLFLSLARRRRFPGKFQYATASYFRSESVHFGTCSAVPEASPPQQQRLVPATLRLLECIMVRFPWVFIRHCTLPALAITITISISALANTVRDNSIPSLHQCALTQTPDFPSLQSFKGQSAADPCTIRTWHASIHQCTHLTFHFIELFNMQFNRNHPFLLSEASFQKRSLSRDNMHASDQINAWQGLASHVASAALVSLVHIL